MKVSVIIPYTDRDREFLQRAIDSVEAQTRFVDEVIPVYDAERRGIAWARNTGLAESTGDLILPLDCDDWIEPTYVEKTIAKMQPGVGIVSTAFVYHGLKEGLIMPAKVMTYATELGGNNITVTSLVRREAIPAEGWCHETRGWEDWDMWLRILRAGWTHDVVPEVLFHYRLHDSGMNAWAQVKENKRKLWVAMIGRHPGFGHITPWEKIGGS